MRLNHIPQRPPQRGAVLLVSLMILLIMTVLGIAGMSSTTMEEKMAANNQQQQQAFQAAETALRAGEAWLTANVTTVGNLSLFSGANGLYSLSPLGTAVAAPAFDIYDNSAWTAARSAAAPSLLSGQAVPRYIVEYLGQAGGGGAALDANNAAPVARYAFRITAIGWSVDGTARYLAWSHYTRRLN